MLIYLAIACCRDTKVDTKRQEHVEHCANENLLSPPSSSSSSSLSSRCHSHHHHHHHQHHHHDGSRKYHPSPYGGIVKLTPPPPPHRLRLVLALLLLPLMLVLLLLLLLRLLLRQLLLLRRLLLLLLLVLALLCASAAGSHVLRLLGGFLSSLTRMDKSISQGHPTAASVCIMSVVKLLRDAFGLGPQNAPSGSRPTRHCFVLLTVPVTLPVYSWQYLKWHRAFKTTTTFVATLRSWHE